MSDEGLSVKPEGNWGIKFPLTAEQWYLQIKERIPVGLNKHGRIVFVAANYAYYCENFKDLTPTVHVPQPTCWHKEIDDEGICKACGAKAAIRFEGVSVPINACEDALNVIMPIVNAALIAVQQQERERATLAEHKSHIDFENELYATLVDPVAEGVINESEMRKQLLESARWYRQHAHDLETQLNSIREGAKVSIPTVIEDEFAKWAQTLEAYPSAASDTRALLVDAFAERIKKQASYTFTAQPANYPIPCCDGQLESDADKEETE
jgi:hypothetical protein